MKKIPLFLCLLFVLGYNTDAQTKTTPKKNTPKKTSEVKKATPVLNNTTDNIKEAPEIPSPEIPSVAEPTKPETQKEKVYEYTEIEAEYPGGDSALLQYLSTQMHYPDSARNNNIEGRVVLSFIVCADGKLCDVNVIRSVHPVLDEEAVRAVKAMKNWKPGKQDGKPVSSYFSLPIVFQLEE